MQRKRRAPTHKPQGVHSSPEHKTTHSDTGTLVRLKYSQKLKEITKGKDHYKPEPSRKASCQSRNTCRCDKQRACGPQRVAFRTWERTGSSEIRKRVLTPISPEMVPLSSQVTLGGIAQWVVLRSTTTTQYHFWCHYKQWNQKAHSTSKFYIHQHPHAQLSNNQLCNTLSYTKVSEVENRSQTTGRLRMISTFLTGKHKLGILVF